MVALNHYSRLDRLVHRIAFLSPGIQIAAAEIEDSLLGRDLDRRYAGAPIFITSLPRAGTTVLLSALSSLPGLATHTYRDMPFVMAPLLWSRLSGRFRKRAELRERAHGDGVAIGYDSPEAFEEVIWRAFWPEHFEAHRISLWAASDVNKEAQTFMQRHFQKIVALRCEGAARDGRYISKNNANIARLDLIKHMFADAKILVPVRSPMSHAASLHRQHRNFLERHSDDDFARRYMGDIGHYEFGALHRPIRFEGLDALLEGLSPGDLDYWLAYWVAAFEHIGRHRESLCLLGYESLCRDGEAAAAELCQLLGIDESEAPGVGSHFRPSPPLQPELEAYRGQLRDRAEAIYTDLVNA